MAHIGFKTQLFGFNKEEVNLYLKKLELEQNQREDSLNKKVEELIKTIEEKAEALALLEVEYAEVKARADYYKDKETEIEKTSISIATMYLVAKQSSEEMLSAARETAKEISDLSGRQLDAADAAAKRLSDINEALAKSAEGFEGQITGLTRELGEVKARLSADMALFSKDNLIEITDGGSNLE